MDNYFQFCTIFLRLLFYWKTVVSKIKCSNSHKLLGGNQLIIFYSVIYSIHFKVKHLWISQLRKSVSVELRVLKSSSSYKAS